MQAEIWTKEKLKLGFDEFLTENGHLPTAPEIDACDYLPSSRQIQRSFGGVRQLREELGYEHTDFGRGEFRSKFATINTARGSAAEKELGLLLIEKFGEPYVHIEKRYGAGTNRLDFFVYVKDINFGVDVFYSTTGRDIQKNLNLKVDKYAGFPATSALYFVLANPDFDALSLAQITLNMSKLATIPSLRVIDMKSFIEDLAKYEPLALPVHFMKA